MLDSLFTISFTHLKDIFYKRIQIFVNGFTYLTLFSLKLQGFHIFHYFFCESLRVLLIRRWVWRLLFTLTTQVRLYCFQPFLRKGTSRRSLNFFQIVSELICDLRLTNFFTYLYQIHIYLNYWIVLIFNILMLFF